MQSYPPQTFEWYKYVAKLQIILNNPWKHKKWLEMIDCHYIFHRNDLIDEPPVHVIIWNHDQEAIS